MHIKDKQYENPFYSQHVFSEHDLQRATLKWHHRLFLLFNTMYVQIAEGYAVHFKRTSDGRVFIFKLEQL